MLETFAAAFLVFAFTALALFELAIALGAPLGEYSFGGQNKGVLPTHWRVVAFVFVFVALGIAGHYLAQTGAISPLLSSSGNSFVNWFLVGFTALSALGNNLTRSQKEKRLWGGTTIAMLLSAIIVAI